MEEYVYDGTQSVQNSTETEKCPACGAQLIFNPKLKCLKCEYCGVEKQVDLTTTCSELDIAFISEKNTWGAETHVVMCKNCGSKHIISKNEIAMSCPFCGTATVVETSELSGLKPNAIVPFTLTKEQSVEKAKTWAKKRFFAPTKFKKNLTCDNVGGVYNPSFTFDSSTHSVYSGRLGEYYYVKKTVNGKQVQERRTRYFDVHGSYSKLFDDVLEHATNDSYTKYYKKIEPYSTNNAKMYNTDFLKGFSAKQYSKSGEECWKDAQSYMDRMIKKGILSQYHYDFVDYLHVNTKHSNVKFKYVLLPLYVGHYKWSQKIFNFFVNGETGKVSGKTPVSGLKVFAFVATILAIAVFIGYLIYKNKVG